MKHGRRMVFRIVAFILITAMMAGTFTVVNAVEGIYHEPTGWDDLYGGTEVESNDCERYPRDPVAGETVYLKSKTWPSEDGDAVWVTWTKNSVEQPVVNAEWKYNSGNDTHWEANMGSFAKGDVVTYTLHANQNGANEKTTGPYTFIVTDWDYVNIDQTSEWKHYMIGNLALSGDVDIGFYINSPGGTTCQIDGVKLVKTG